MATADVNIKIIGSYNGRAVERAMQGLEKLNAQAALAGSSTARSFTQAGTSLMEQGAILENVGFKVEQHGKKWLGVTAAVTGVGVATGAAAVSIDTALTGVRKTVDATDDQYQHLKDSAIEYSKTNAISAEQVLRAEELGGQLGVAYENLESFAEVATGLDISTDMNVETASSNMQRFANITKMATDDYERYGNTVVGLGNNLATTESELSDFSLRMASAGTIAGMSQADILGIAGAMSSLGLEAQAGGSAFSKTISEISTAVSNGGSELEGFAAIAGMSASEFATAWKEDATSAFVSFIEGLAKGREAGEDMNVMLGDLGITELRQSDAMRRLASNTDLLTDAIKLSNDEWDHGTALQDEVANRNDSMAGKFEMLKNKVIAVAEKVGTPLVNALIDAVDAAQPVLDAVEGIATAFADADPATQRFILGIAGAAAAVGPLLIASGKYLQFAGSVTKAIGSKTRAIGTLVNLTKTDNTELLRRTATEGTFAQKLAVSRNALAQHTSQVSQHVSKVKASTAASKANATAITATGTAAQGFGMKTRSTTTAVQSQTVAMKAGSSAAKGFSLAMKAAAPIAAITAITTLVSVIGDYIDKQKKIEQATTGLSSSTAAMAASYDGARVSVDSFGTSTEGAGSKMSNLSAEIDAMVDRNAELASSITSIYSEAGTSLGMMDNYRSVIEELGGGTNLTAEEAAKLKLAIEGVNDKCGTSYEVAGNAEEGYRIMADGAEVAKDEILRLVDAQKEQIRLEASKEAYAEAYKSLADSTRVAAEATQRYNDVLSQYNEACDQASQGNVGAAQTLEGLAQQVSNAEREMDRANSTYEAQKSTLDALGDSQTLYQMALDAGAGSLAAAVAGNDRLTAAMAAADKSTVDLASQLESLGVSTQTVTSLTAEESAKLAEIYNGTAESVSAALYTMATDASTQGANAGRWLTEGFSTEAQGAVNAATDVTGLTTAQFKLIADSAGIEGEEAITALANSIIANSSKSTGAARIVRQALVLELTNGDVKLAAQILGEDIDQGLVDGINGSASLPPEAIGLMSQQTIDNAKAQFESQSPSQVMHRLGEDVDAGLANGIEGAQDQPVSAMGSLAQSAIAAISGMPGQAQGTGTSASTLFATGIGSQVGSVLSNATSLMNSAKNGISGTPGSYSGTGSQSATSFAKGIGAGSAYTQGADLAQTGKNGLESVSAYSAGGSFVRGFGNGMSGVSLWSIAYNVGRSALNAIKSALGIASPSKEAAAVGEFFDLGLIQGMESKQRDVAAQARALEGAMEIDPRSPEWQRAFVPLYEQTGGYGRRAQQSAQPTSVTYYYTFGDITLNAADAAGVAAIDDVVAVFEQAARMNPSNR